MSNTFLDYWRHKTASDYPDTVIMKISVASFRKELEKAYNAGSRDSGAVAKQMQNIGKSSKTPIADTFDDIFGDLFKGKK